MRLALMIKRHPPLDMAAPGTKPSTHEPSVSIPNLNHNRLCFSTASVFLLYEAGIVKTPGLGADRVPAQRLGEGSTHSGISCYSYTDPQPVTAA